MKLVAPSRRDLRFVSGLILFAYLTGHLVNHALGLISLSAAEYGLEIASAIWQGPVGTFLLYGSALVHMGLALHAVYERRTLRMPFRDLLRIVLGLNLPVLLIAHAAGTRLAMEFYGYHPFYTDVVRDLWTAGSQGKQFALLAPGWIHGCLGLHAAFGQRKWWRAALPVLFGIFIVLPILSALGFVDMHREIERFNPPGNNGAGFPRENVAAIVAWRDRAVNIYLGLVALAFVARGLRWLYERRRDAVVDMTFPARKVRAPRGWSVLEASRANNMGHPSACGGRARCSTCRVRVTEGIENCPPPNGDEAATLKRISAAGDVRLACQLRPTGPVSVSPLLGPNGALLATATREEPYAVMVVDLLEREALSRALLPQDLQWLLSGIYRAVEDVVRHGGGTVLHVGQDQACAVFPAVRNPARACARALEAARALEKQILKIALDVNVNWKASMRATIALHVGPVLLDPGQLNIPGSKIAVAVGPAIDDVNRMRGRLLELCGGSLVSDALLVAAGEDPEHFGEPVEAGRVTARLMRASEASLAG